MFKILSQDLCKQQKSVKGKNWIVIKRLPKNLWTKATASGGNREVKNGKKNVRKEMVIVFRIFGLKKSNESVQKDMIIAFMIFVLEKNLKHRWKNRICLHGIYRTLFYIFYNGTFTFCVVQNVFYTCLSGIKIFSFVVYFELSMNSLS